MLGTNERNACVKEAAPSTWKHRAFQAEKSDLDFAVSLGPTDPGFLIYQRIWVPTHRTGMKHKREKWLRVPHAFPARLRSNVQPVQIPFYCSSQFPAGWQLSAWCWQVMRKPSVSKDSAYVKYMSLPPAGITLFSQTEITGRERLCVPSRSAAWTIKY